MAIQRSRSGKRLVLIPIVGSAFFFMSLFEACGGNTPKDKPSGVKPDAAQTKKLYDTKCAICHGFDGRQQYAGAKDLGLTSLNKDQIVTQIAEGKGSMPPQKEVLTTEEMEALADFVLLLHAK